MVPSFGQPGEVLGFFGGITWALLVARVCWVAEDPGRSGVETSRGVPRFDSFPLENQPKIPNPVFFSAGLDGTSSLRCVPRTCIWGKHSYDMCLLLYGYVSIIACLVCSCTCSQMENPCFSVNEHIIYNSTTGGFSVASFIFWALCQIWPRSRSIYN